MNLRTVKPYYISGYRNRILNRFTRIITIFTAKIHRNDKILPFLPLILYVAYPLFFNVNFSQSDIDKMQLLPLILALLPLELIVVVTIIWWMYCAENFDIKKILGDSNDLNHINPIKAYKEDGLLMSIFVLVMGILVIGGFLSLPFLGAGLVVGINSALTMLISKNETVNFYIATLPLALGLSYATLLELKKKRGE